MSTPTKRPLRIVLSKVGLDGHDRGIKVVARALKDAGFEVIYTGLHQTPENVVEAAIQEDADLIGVSMLSAAHMTIFPRILDLLTKRGARKIGLFGGGIIPPADVRTLEKKGVLMLFGPGTTLAEITDWCSSYRPPKGNQLAHAPVKITRSAPPSLEPTGPFAKPKTLPKRRRRS